MRIERDARAPQHLIHVRSPDFALEAAAERRGGGQGSRKITPQFEIVAFGNSLQQRDSLSVVRRHGADKGDVDIQGRCIGQRVENGRFKRQVTDFGPNTTRPKAFTVVGNCEIIRS